MENDRSSPSDIAIVGISGRFPGDASNPQRLWDMIAQGRSARTEIPQQRFNADGFYHPHPERQGTINTRHGHFMAGELAAFDPSFFSLKPAEAEAMDPQQRLALECTYEAMENAGMRIQDVQGSNTSCFVGSFTQDYSATMGYDPEDIPQYRSVTTGAAMLSNRVSHFFDLRGPSMTIDTACSSSLVALDLACQSLQNGKSTMAVVGGTNFILCPEVMTGMSGMNFLSPDGKSYSFDHRANGYSRGEGAAFCILKSVTQAIIDGNVIRGVIRGTGTNQDGHTPGITVPSADAQAALIRQVYANAQLDLVDTVYVEAHGTGTPTGDPIEASALGATFGKARGIGDPVHIGSVKTNIGHLEGAAGLSQVIKSVLMLENGQIPPSINYERPNPRIPMEDWNLVVPTQLLDWPRKGVRRISVNSFGYGGSNAHCIIDDAYHYLKDHNLSARHNVKVGSGTSSPSSFDSGVDVTGGIHPLGNISGRNGSLSTTPHNAPAYKLIVWSAHDEMGVARNAEALHSYLADKVAACPGNLDTVLLGQFSNTLALSRASMQWRSFALATSCESACDELHSLRMTPIKAKRHDCAFIFTGQGSQWYAMGRELLAYGVFRETLETADAYFSELGSEWSLLGELLKDENASRLKLATLSQPVTTALQIALVDLLYDWGIRPKAVVGHSSGEIAAAYAKGAIAKEDAWKIAYYRGSLFSRTLSKSLKEGGAMMAVGLGCEMAQRFIDRLPDCDGVAAVACVNSPVSTTLSGDSSAIHSITSMVEKELPRTFMKRLDVEVAYHSPHMKSISEQYRTALGDVRTLGSDGNGEIAMFSSLTGEQVSNPELQADYWVSNMVEQVRFSDAMRNMLSQSDSSIGHIVEIGPSRALRGPFRQIMDGLPSSSPARGIIYQSVLEAGRDACVTALTVAGRLFQSGHPVNIMSVNQATGHDQNDILVDLPSYAWNHDHKYWFSSRPYKAHHNRPYPRTDLLGLETWDGLPGEPRFRNILRLSEIPWTRHHKVQGSILYPAAGMLVMAIEAVRQGLDPCREVEGYELRDVIIGKALIIPEDDRGVEVTLSMKSDVQTSTTPHSEWQEFRLYSSLDVRELSCSGLIRVKYNDPVDDAFLDEQIMASSTYAQRYTEVRRGSTRRQLPQEFYENAEAKGLEYGPVFRTLHSLHRGGNQCVFEIKIPDTKSTMPHGFEFPHIIHPTTLDGVLQMVAPAWMGISENLDGVVVPTSIAKLYISGNMPTDAGVKLSGYSHGCSTSSESRAGSVTVSDENWTKPFIIVEEVKGRLVAPPASSDIVSLASLRKLNSHFEWREDITHLTRHQLRALCAEGLDNSQIPSTKIWADIEVAAFIFVKRVLREISPVEASGFAWHLKLYYDYMQRCWQRGVEGKLCYQRSTPELDWLHLTDEQEVEIVDRVRKASVNGTSLVHHCERLTQILRGQIAPHQVLWQDQILDKLYNRNISAYAVNYPMQRYLNLLSHKRCHLKILEIGAGFAATTIPVLEALGGKDNSQPRFDNYTFTDISPGFLLSAEEKLAAWAPLVTFATLDIEKDAAEQGFVEESYDLIVAANVFHATRSISNTLRNTKKLLKPDGELILVETTNPNDRMVNNMIVGSLEGWWYGQEDGRKDGPLMTESMWHDALIDAGFTGIELAFRNSDDPLDILDSVMIISPSCTSETPGLGDILVVTPTSSSTEVVKFAELLDRQLHSRGTRSVTTLNLADTHGLDLSGKMCLLLLEAGRGHSFLAGVNQEDWAHLKHLTLACNKITAITRGATLACNRPHSNMMTGLARTIRGESPTTLFATIDMEYDTPLDTDENARLICDIFGTAMLTSKSSGTDLEYAISGGKVMIPRLVCDEDMNDLLATHNSKPEPEMGPFEQENRLLKLDIGVQGQFDTLRFQDDKTAEDVLGDDEVEIAVKAAGLDSRDVKLAKGQISNDGYGIDCSGVIKRVGPRVTAFRPGDRVMAWASGTHGSLVRSKASLVHLVPEDIDFPTAASMPLIYCTAYFALTFSGRLRRGETLLIHAAAGAVGQAAIVLAQEVGAEIFATVASGEEKQLMMEQYGVPDSHIFSSRNESFVNGVLRVTKNRGVDLILNSLSGEMMRQSMSCVAPFGRFIDIGSKDDSGLATPPLTRNITFQSIHMDEILKADIQLAAYILGEVMKSVRSGVAKPVTPVSKMLFSQAEEAFRMIESGTSMGKIVFETKGDDKVPIIPRRMAQFTFQSEATYIIAGGSGGLGRCIAEWMVASGAKSILLLCRSGDGMFAVEQLLGQLRTLGARVAAWNCDISNEKDLLNVMAQFRTEGWPRIRGLIQCAMVLNDSVYENMTHEQFVDATRPKVQGSWNLHTHLPKDMDFFIMLSSLASIVGNRGQGNYVAGNCFQDALAHHRRSRGLNSCSMDIGVIRGVGFVAEATLPDAPRSAAVTANLNESHIGNISEAEFLATLEAAMVGHSTTPGRPVPAQLVTGFPTGGMGKTMKTYPWWLHGDARFIHMSRMDAHRVDEKTKPAAVTPLRERLSGVRTADEAVEVVVVALTERLAKLMSMAQEDVDTGKPVNAYGVDSLFAVELRSWLYGEIKADISVFDLLSNISIVSLAKKVVSQSDVLPSSVESAVE